jgi:alpha-ketoglutarate-dependent taurine dioxygenase
MEVKQLEINGQQHYDTVFPLAYGVNKEADLTAAEQWVREHKVQLLQQLSHHGAILLRDFGLQSDMDFDAMVRAFELPNFTYADSLSNAVRTNRTERVFTANEAPADISIFLHHEMAQTPVYPSRLFFFCELAADTGGATPLCRSDVLLEQLRRQQPQFVADCERLGVKYSNTMPAANDQNSAQGRSWKSTLTANDKQSAEAKLQKLGYTWQWLSGGSLRVTTPTLPAINTLPDGRQVFFNQLIAAYRGWEDSRNKKENSICFGDGSNICKQGMLAAIELGEKLSFDMPWQNGDMVLVDNYLVMHGRRPYMGNRKILASLVA